MIPVTGTVSSPKPQYARFWKADLQMQTPVDMRHWCGDSARLTSSSTAEEIAASARAYAARCYEVGLEMWGLTDHNLGGDAAKIYLEALKSAIEELAPDRQWRPLIFPGFEIEANVGKGLHLLCLFDPSVAFDDVDDVLTDLGLPRKSRFGKGGKPLPLKKSLDEVLDCVQDKHGGLVIAAHPDSSKGALSDDDLARWLSVSVITNERLLCMELRKGRDEYTADSGTLGAVVRNDAGDWHRPHPIAVVTSSDCKKLTPDDGSGDESWIGKRFTWLKMSERSIEGLRQAFLDHESRIRQGQERPEELEVHPRITRIAVSGVDFLSDIDIALSPNLTSLIGGGGTGKSTLIEYCRAALQQGVSDEASDVQGNHDKLLQSLGGGSVTLTMSQGGSEIVGRLTAAGVVAQESDGAAVDDLATRFPVMVLGQREVYAVAESPLATRTFIDRLQGDRIRELEHQEGTIRARVEDLNEALDRIPKLEARLRELKQEKARFESALQTLRTQQKPLERLDAFRREETAIARLEKDLQGRARVIRDTANATQDELPPMELEPPTPSVTALKSFESRASLLAAEVAALLNEAAEKLTRFIRFEAQAAWRSTWQTEFDQALAAYEAVATSDAKAGPTAEELRSDIDSRDNEIATVTKQIGGMKKKAADRPDMLLELKDTWDEQVSARREIANRLRALVPRTATGEPYVEVSVDPYGDESFLSKAVYERIADNRAFNNDDASELVRAVYAARSFGQESTSLLCSWLRRLQADEKVEELKSFSVARLDALRRSFTESEIRKLEVLRPLDTVRVDLRRPDGSVAGSLDSGLSVGQRCTAILALVLSAGDFPILIDQPEDEIDNEFIYRELVPLLRRAKHKRQIIVSTHDPNLPVNGDAELILALEARSFDGGSVRGYPKTVEGGPAIGSLDRKRVKLAVEEIMEGSEEAFRRRHARYGF